MPIPADPIAAMRKKAAAMPDVHEGTACNQSSFKFGKKSFFFVGPGAKGVGFKAMFKLNNSIAQAEKLADKKPEVYSVGKNGWVTARFSVDKPLPKSVWEKWVKEAYEIAAG